MRFLVAFFLVCVMALPGLAQNQGIQIQVSLPNASPEEIARFRQDLSQVELVRLYGRLPEAQKQQIKAIAVGPSSDGLVVKLSVEGSPEDARQIAQALSVPISEDAARIRPSRLQISAYRIQIASPYSIEKPSHWPWAVGLLALLALAALVALRFRKTMPLPRIMGVPLVGTVPQDALYINSEPCLALGSMFLMATQNAKRGEVVVRTPNGQAIVPACMAKALAKEGHRVLIVDRFGEKSDLAKMFEAGGEGEGEKLALDILSMPHQKMTLPTTLRENYDWILYFSPEFMPQKRSIVVLDRAPLPLAVLGARLEAILRQSPLLGVVLVGIRPPEKVMARYHLHYNFERLRRLERG